MKRLILIALIALAGCAAQPKVDQAYVDVVNYARESDGQATAGSLTWEDRYVRLFELSAGIQNPTIRAAYRTTYSDMIETSRKFDAKQISKEEFSDARRKTFLRVEAAVDQAKARQADAEAQQNAALVKILQNNQAQQNAVYQQQMQQILRPQTNCTSTVYGNTMQTNCR